MAFLDGDLRAKRVPGGPGSMIVARNIAIRGPIASYFGSNPSLEPVR